MKTKRIARAFAIAVVALTVTCAVFGLAVSALWNVLMPEVFGLHTIGFWQALGLLALSWILFGGFGMLRGRPRFSNVRNRRMMEHWARMSPEEREKFAQEFRRRCHGTEPPMSEPKGS
jgi:hypothetical protein